MLWMSAALRRAGGADSTLSHFAASASDSTDTLLPKRRKSNSGHAVAAMSGLSLADLKGGYTRHVLSRVQPCLLPNPPPVCRWPRVVVPSR
jgi:hypothetical protein